MKKNIIILSLFCLLFTACSGFLDETNKAGVGSDYYDTEEGIENAVKACYSYLRDNYTPSQYGGELGNRLFVYGTDDHLPADGYAGAWSSYTIASTSGEVRTLWDRAYQVINNCNAVVSHMPRIKGTTILDTEEKKNIRLGEVRFLRAYNYYKLVLSFGDIPLKLDETTQALTEFKRSPAKEVYSQVIEDLIFAEEHLPEVQKNYGRVTKGAAQHLLAKVYLTRASAVTEDRGTQSDDLDKAISYAEKCINTGTYKLEPEINNIFAYDGKGPYNKEFIFTAQFTSEAILNGSGNSSHMMWTGNAIGMNMYSKRTLETGRNWTKIKPSKYLLDSYNLRYDSRFYKWFRTAWYCNQVPATDAKFAIGDTIVQYVMVETHDQIPASIKNSNHYKNGKVYARDEFTGSDYPSTRKHIDPYRETENSEDGYRDEPIYRLAETYLIAAEAYGRKGNYDKAVEFINAIRIRAAYKDDEKKPEEVFTVHKLPETYRDKNTIEEMKISVNDINSKEKLVEFILDEYARELNGEYGRWFELVRTETWYDRVSKYTKDVYTNIQPYYRFRPIPQTHIDRLTNPGPINEEQNAGYY